MKIRKALLLTTMLAAWLLLASCSRQKPDFTALTANADRAVVKLTKVREETFDPGADERLRALTDAAARALDDCAPYGYIDPYITDKWRATFFEGEKETLKIELWLTHLRGWVVSYEIDGDRSYYCCDYWDDENERNLLEPPDGIAELIRAFNDLSPIENDTLIDYILGGASGE